MKKNKTQTIGEWLPKLGATIKPSGFWTIVRDDNGVHAVVYMRVTICDANGTVLATTRTKMSGRGGDYPLTCEAWEPGSPAVVLANQRLDELEAKDYSSLPALSFWGVNRVMPWELPRPRKGFWARLWARLAFWKKAKA